MLVRSVIMQNTKLYLIAWFVMALQFANEENYMKSSFRTNILEKML